MLNVVRTNALFCDKMETSCKKNVAKRSLYKEKDVSLHPCKLNNMNTNRTSKAFIVRAAITLLLLLLTSATAWAENVSYIDENGVEKYVDATILTSETDIREDLPGGWYIVKNTNSEGVDVTFSSQVNFGSATSLILADGASITIVGDNGIVVYGNLNIYSQSEGTGSLSTKATGDGGDGIWASGNICIIGGIITTTSNNHYGITNESGNITITGGKVTANGESYGIFAQGTVNLSGGIVTTNKIGNISLSGAIVTASSYSGTVTVQSGVTYTQKDLTTNYTENIDVSSLNGITLLPTTCFGIATGSDGSEGKPYTITSSEELLLLAFLVNEENTFSSKYIQVTNNIDMYGIDFSPIGFKTGTKFCGNFDGGGYIISNLYINIYDTCIGLFGFVNDNNATVQNITISNATINGDEYVGGIVGALDNGSIMNCCVINSKITSSTRVQYYGAIVGKCEESGTLDHNYYDNSTVNEKTSNVGCGNKDGSSDVLNNDGALSATILSDSENVPSSLSGKVVFRRVFTGGKASTVCLPFAYTPKTSDGTFYTFKNVEYSEGQYIATMEEANKATSPLSANTPYLFMPAGTETKPVLFHGTADYDNSNLGTQSGKWYFYGTYEPLTYGTGQFTDPVYGFAANAMGNVIAGEFVRADVGAYIPPMRCFLKYGLQSTRGETEELPERITVKLVNDPTSIGTITTQTGKVTFDGWYSLEGQRFNSKPTRKGLYINKGIKVMIK